MYLAILHTLRTHLDTRHKYRKITQTTDWEEGQKHREVYSTLIQPPANGKSASQLSNCTRLRVKATTQFQAGIRKTCPRTCPLSLLASLRKGSHDACFAVSFVNYYEYSISIWRRGAANRTGFSMPTTNNHDQSYHFHVTIAPHLDGWYLASSVISVT